MKNRMLKRLTLRLAPVVFVLLSTSPLLAQTPAPTPSPTPAPAENFDKTEQMIVMRDGARLYTLIFAPENAKEPLPIIFFRTPYGVSGWGERSLNSASLKELVDEGYVFAFQDIRGRYKSEGAFVMERPPRANPSDPKAVDEGTDAYDTIDWMVKNVPNNNGRVGMTGGSYDAWLAVMATLEPHPALKTVVEHASPADSYMGDDFLHNGAFRLSYGFEYAYQLESSKEDANFKFDRYDTYDWYLRLGALSNVNEKYFNGKLPTWNNFVAHPNYDEFWKSQALAGVLKRPTVPIMHVAGWWDQEDFYGPLKAYELLEKSDANKLNYLVVGPWNHGGWERRDGDKLGNVNFESATSKHFREKIRAPWFAHFLKDRGGWSQPEAVTFQTGANKWMSYETWPPRAPLVAERSLYFHGGGRLSFDPPTQNGPGEFDSYVSDPAHPVPYRPRPVEPTYNPSARGGSRWYTWLLEDQRFVHQRPDVLSWETEALTEDVVLSGRIVAHLFSSTSGTDGDWVVKLIDVYPEEYPKEAKMGGYQLMVAGDILRGRFRKSFEKPEPVAPGEVSEYVIDLHTGDHRFLKGHKIMVQVQSTWFPLYDRNPQKFVPNIYLAKDADYQKATQRVFRSKRFPSRVTIQAAAR
ncbi:MAG TPA: CocE/NonD family hydrolase [Pyrinomonadaceae bacterium]|nr:CocE/NonD family hydrolase [Pyrinomonadaceae bacterium]